MTRRRVLVLFCGRTGGSSAGYHRAGYAVTGVDIAAPCCYPFDHIQSNAFDILRDREYCRTFDLIHASPPCQANSALTRGTNRNRAGHVDLIPQVRAALIRLGVPWIIENVQGAAMRRDYTLCGEMFGLGVIRHRYFETHGAIAAPVIEHQAHRGRVAGWRHGQRFDGPYVAVYGDGGGKGTVREWQTAMGIPWCSHRDSLADAIPPAYTEHLGRGLCA